MVSPGEKAIQKEIEKAQEWYGKTYKNTFEVHQRYDKVEKHFSYRLVAMIGGQERVLAFGVSAQTMEGPMFFQIKAKLVEFIKRSLIAAHTKYGTDWKALAKQQGLE